MTDLYHFLFDTSQWPARWNCGNWTAPLGYTHIISELLIFSAYFAIPVILTYCYFKIKGFALDKIFALFAIFIVACGTGHLVEAIIFYYPVYRLAGLVKVITAIVSWMTVFALIPYIKKLTTLPKLILMNRELSEKKDELNRQLERTNLALVENKKALEEFSYHVAHDLKEPIRGMAGYASILIDDPESQHSQYTTQLLEKIVMLGSRSQEMINNLLLYAKSSNQQEQRTVFPLGPVIDDLIEELCMPKERGTITVNTELPEVYTSLTGVKEILRNLISNAIKYNDKEKSEVKVGSYEESLQHVVYVKDNGFGIPAEEQDKVFDLFYRGSKATGKQSNGLGLGICKKYVERAGGTLWLKSEANKGTTFYFSIPKESPEQG